MSCKTTITTTEAHFPLASHEAREKKQKNGIDFNRALRDTFKCFITNRAMKNPSVIMCGDSFEYSAIAEHFQTQSNCPKCNKSCSAMVMPNNALKEAIEAWKEEGHGSCTTTEEGSIEIQRRILLRESERSRDSGNNATEEGLCM
jgi:hypothetical protein